MSEIDSINEITSENKNANENPEKEADKELTENTNDVYAYLNSGEFSSENFKIEIQNLPKYYGINQIKKLLNDKLKLGANKIKTVKKNCPFLFVCFRNETDKENAIKVLNNYNWKNRNLKVTNAKPAADPLVKKRKQETENEGAGKRVKIDDRSLAERLASTTVPLWGTPYEKQLEIKQEGAAAILKRLLQCLRKENPQLRPWLDGQAKAHGGLPCPLENIRYPQLESGYRNKCEFTVGTHEETGLPAVGFRVGRYATGKVGVGPIDGLPHVPECMKLLTKVFEEFVQNSDLRVFEPEHQTGHFRHLTVRRAQEQLMLVVAIHPQNLSVEQTDKFKDELKRYFFEGDGRKAGITSLYYKTVTKKNSNDDVSVAEHLCGSTFITETVLGYKFKVSADAFFQVNTRAAEVLYEAAIGFAQPDKDSTVIDVCCGTGTIGICFAKKCKKVLGLEIVPQAIEDAKENAKVNGIENCEFFAGSAEDILGDVIRHAGGGDLVAVVDPPRAGLHLKVIHKLRRCEAVSKLVYVSCNAEAATKNFVDLCRPVSKTMSGVPFVPLKAVAVDMFPHTKHCELVLYFERFDGAAGAGSGGGQGD